MSKTRYMVVALVVLMVVAMMAIVGCSSSSSSASASADSASASAEASAAAAVEDPTKDNPIVVDKEKGEIRYLGFVNGTYFTEDTRHGVVFQEGGNGDKSIVAGYGSEKDFYQACIDMGWTEGDNLTMDNMAGGDAAKSVEGDKIDVTIRWEGQDEIPFADVYEATNGDTWERDYRFGGNLSRAQEKNTGCVLCLDSCAVGIMSDAHWVTGTTNPDNVTWFHGKADVLPADGTDVIVTFRKAA